ncbi:MAG: 4-hydroxy-3-methylbut-2-enyl diphosphate reductase [Deltaproteobacteria bacterium]|nr:4-hydroxy-3-methylbut-2-enyl diphosphate reductase [Deltaproteobacteria bacterium]
MKIDFSKHQGYCFGVRRAMDLAFKSLAQSGPVYSHGSLIHNRAAGDLLAAKGLKLWPGFVEKGTLATVIVRAHGLAPLAMEELVSQGVKVVDATCPRVLWVQRLVRAEASLGRTVLIWGSAGHPEVEGLLGHSLGQGLVIAGPEDIEKLPDFAATFLVAQTTQDLEIWSSVVAATLKRWPDAKYRDTICRATFNRQTETKRLCRTAQALVVVGGRDSANTQRLAEIGRKAGLPTLAVEGPEEIEPGFVAEIQSVGLAAGASTPIWRIRAVAQRLEALARRQGGSPKDFFRRLLRSLALSNLYVGLGAGALGWAMAKWSGFVPPSFFFGLYFFYVQAMHLLNGFLDRESARHNDPDRAVFLSQYRWPLAFCGITCLFLALSAAHLAGPWVLTQLLIQSALGLAYALPWPFRVFGFKRLSELPLSKTISTSVGWAALLSLPAILADPPLMARDLAGLKLTGLIFGEVFLEVLSRAMIMDLRETQGDWLFGRQTIASFLGRSGAIKLLATILGVWAIYLLTIWFMGGPSVILWLLVFGPIYNALFLKRYWRGLGLMGYQMDIILDARLLICGVAYWLL